MALSSEKCELVYAEIEARSPNSEGRDLLHPQKFESLEEETGIAVGVFFIFRASSIAALNWLSLRQRGFEFENWRSFSFQKFKPLEAKKWF